jgi:ankyrin repeat protein
MASVEYDDISIVNYFLDHGGDPMKADIMGRTVLHHAVVTGCLPPHMHKPLTFCLIKNVSVQGTNAL